MRHALSRAIDRAAPRARDPRRPRRARARGPAPDAARARHARARADARPGRRPPAAGRRARRPRASRRRSRSRARRAPTCSSRCAWPRASATTSAGSGSRCACARSRAGPSTWRVTSRGDYDLALLGWQADTLDPNDFLTALLDSGSIGTTNRSRYRSAAMDALLKRARQDSAPGARLALYRAGPGPLPERHAVRPALPLVRLHRLPPRGARPRHRPHRHPEVRQGMETAVSRRRAGARRRSLAAALVAGRAAAAPLPAEARRALGQAARAGRRRSTRGSTACSASTSRTSRAGATLELRADEPFPTASSIKLAVLYELYRQAEEGRLDLARGHAPAAAPRRRRRRAPGARRPREPDLARPRRADDAAGRTTRPPTC